MSEVRGGHDLGLSSFCSGFTWSHKTQPNLRVKWESLPLFSAAKFLAHMKVKQRDAKVSPKSSKNMKHSSQNNPAGLVHIQVGCVFLHFSPCCFFFLLNIGEAMEIQLCPLFSVTALWSKTSNCWAKMVQEGLGQINESRSNTQALIQESL